MSVACVLSSVITVNVVGRAAIVTPKEVLMSVGGVVVRDH